MITSLKTQEAIILNPIRLQAEQPVTELSFVPPQLRHRTELAVAQEGMRLSAKETERLMGDIQKSVVTVKDDETGLVQFGGTMGHPDFGAVHVRGRGAIHNDRFRAEGCFEFNPRVVEADFPKRLIFLIEKFSIPETDVEQIMTVYEQAIASADRETIKRITEEFSEVFAVVARELEDDGRLVMYVTAPGENVDVGDDVARIRSANVITRIMAKLSFKLEMARGGRIGEFGTKVGSSEAKNSQVPKVRALLTA